MLSIVLYGRNDSYGYNLHKRAALSLNCMAEVLSDPSDEILFVDYNTPDDYPTFPEAIQDTLTEKAKKRLRILRVRPSVHRRFADKTHLIALEPVSRNVAIRRSNPNNRWILSTNTDMIFVPRNGNSLSDIVADLPKGFYHIPRFEIPETLWEMFDRKDAAGTIASIDMWGRKAHLNEIVLGAPTIKYDAPGDFQLIEREDLFRIQGFDEDMLLGWHVDSNIAKRLHLIYGEVGDLVNGVFGYHCDHTRQVTPMHRHNSTQNSIQVFVNDVLESGKPKQQDTWGCPDDEIEEIDLRRMRNAIYLEGLDAIIKQEMVEPSNAFYTSESYNKVVYDPPHVLPFLADIFVNAPLGTRIGWMGANPDLFALFADFWQKLGIGGPILVADDLAEQLSAKSSTTAEVAKFDTINDRANAFIFDYGLGKEDYGSGREKAADETEALKNKNAALVTVKSCFLEAVEKEVERIAFGDTPRRFVCVNAIHNSFEPLVSSFLSVARTPFSSRIRQGFVISDQSFAERDWTSLMLAGPAATKTEAGIRAGTRIGHVMYGPYIVLNRGTYKATMWIESERSRWKKAAEQTQGPDIVVEAVAGDIFFKQQEFSIHQIEQGPIEIEFNLLRQDFIMVDSEGLQIRMWSAGRIPFVVKKIVVTKL